MTLGWAVILSQMVSYSAIAALWPTEVHAMDLREEESIEQAWADWEDELDRQDEEGQSSAMALTETTNRAVSGPAIFLGEGEQRLLHIPDLERLSIGNPSIIRSLKIPSAGLQQQILIKGLKTGVTDLWIWKKNGKSEFRKVEVQGWKSLSVGKNQEFFRQLSTLEEVEIVPHTKGALIRGWIQSLKEAEAIQGLKSAFPEQIKDQSRLSALVKKQALDELSQWLRKSKLQDRLRLEDYGDQIWLRGDLPDENELKKIWHSALAVFPLLQNDLSTDPQRGQTVHISLRLLELHRDQFSQLGLKWPGQLQFGLQSLQYNPFNGDKSALFGALSQEGSLSLNAGRAKVKVLAQPELVLRSPGEAELFAGGELPIEQNGRFQSQVTWKNFGLALKIRINSLKGETIAMEIESEMSRLDQKLSHSQIPSLQTNRLKTQITAQFGRPLLLCGLLQDQRIEKNEGLPFLKDIPILGALFSSQAYLSGQSELVLVLLPQSEAPRASTVPSSLNAVEDMSPRGPIPPPRNWISPEEEISLKSSHQYPWNALR